MTHDEVRDLASAVADGEAAATPAYREHLASCASCSGYAASLDRLRVLTAALPREPAPVALPQRVRSRIGRRRVAFRLVPALAAATAAVLVVTLLPGPASFPVRSAGAAEPLLRLRSLYVERTVGEDTQERIWWRAPGSVRIERHTPDGDTVEIRTPGSAYDSGLLTTGVAPEIALPEPISPTVALLGRDTGPGPEVAGRPTRRYVLTIGGDIRVAYVDAGVALRDDERIVLVKGGGPVTKRVTAVRIDTDIPDSTFAAPAGATRTDAGFRSRPLGSLRVEPASRPAGFSVVTAGRGPDGDAVLFARGSLPVLVRTGGLAASERGEVRTVVRGGRSYLVRADLYAPPGVQVVRRGVTLTVSAPLPLDALVELAARMYPE
ncbi:MAG: hypothetical protein QOE45_2038 [Frankiaceae bacterium]|jgi:hypothetical protein|nr:hypothetical protein [Frankiaceae bacterium]